MKRTLQKIAAILLSIMLLCNYASASTDGASTFYNTYWLMRSYTGNFDIVFYENGTYFSQSHIDSEMRSSGQWSYSNNILTLDGINYSKRSSDREIWYATDDGSIGLYPNLDATGFDSIAIYVYGSKVKWTDAVPFIDSNNRTMVPLRAVADAMGLNVTWNQSTQTATFSGPAYYDDGTELPDDVGGLSGKLCEVTINFTIGEKAASVLYKSPGPTVTQTSTKTMQMDTTPVILDGRTYAPIRYLAEAFGFRVDWNGSQKTINLIYGYILHPFH